MAKKVPTRVVPTLSPQARNFVLQGQPDPLPVAAPQPPPVTPAAPVAPAPTPVSAPVVAAPEAPPPAVAQPPAAPPTPALAPAPTPAKPARTSAASASATAAARRPRSLVARVDGRTLRRLQLYFDADVARKLKHHCVEHDVDMSAYVNELVARALRGS